MNSKLLGLCMLLLCMLKSKSQPFTKSDLIYVNYALHTDINPSPMTHFWYMQDVKEGGSVENYTWGVAAMMMGR